MGRTGAFAGLIAAFVLLPSALPAQPAGPGLSTYLASWAVIDEQGGFNQSYIAYWSDPRDVRRHKDGAFYGVMGGAHQLLYIETNFVPGDHYFVDPAARGNFSRDGGGDGRRGGVFAAPRAFGEVGGGTIYGDVIVFTRDGRSALEPAPLGPLLESEIARLRKAVADMDAADARALRQLEASMTPQVRSERRSPAVSPLPLFLVPGERPCAGPPPSPELSSDRRRATPRRGGSRRRPPGGGSP